MICDIYTIYDTKSKAYMSPIYQINIDTMMRDLITSLQDKEHFLAKNPEDFQLFKLGTYNDQNGEIDSIPPEHITNMTTLLRDL